MNLNLDALRAVGVPESLLAPLTAPPDTMRKERYAKLTINLSPREKSLWDLLCYLQDDLTTVAGRRVIRAAMETMAMAQERRIGRLAAELKQSAALPDARRKRVKPHA